MKKIVTERALLARVNRVLAHDNLRLYRNREGDRAGAELGRFYIVDLRNNAIEASHCDLEKEARELDCLTDWETLGE